MSRFVSPALFPNQMMIMTRLQSFLERACADLGLAIVAPVVLTVREGIQIHAEALIPQLGGAKGMIVVSRYEDLRGIASELPQLGYGYSVLSEPPPWENYDLESHAEMFAEWGWGNNNERKPDWIKTAEKGISP